MIRVKVYKEKEQIKKITFRGHAMYDDVGKDIVCAASSASVLTTINGILNIDNNSIEIKQENNNIDIIVKYQDEIVIKLLQNMLNCLQSIKENYPKNIEIIEEE